MLKKTIIVTILSICTTYIVASYDSYALLKANREGDFEGVKKQIDLGADANFIAGRYSLLDTNAMKLDNLDENDPKKDDYMKIQELLLTKGAKHFTYVPAETDKPSEPKVETGAGAGASVGAGAA